jgi:hypothetical protein
LSRINPDDLACSQLGANNNYVTFSASPENQVIALSMIMVNKCAVYNLPREALNQKRKEISGHFHSQEFDRMMGVLSVVYGINRLKPYIFQSAIPFTTIPIGYSNPNGMFFSLFIQA